MYVGLIFSKAFDVVNHEILINKLKALHISVFVFHWIISFSLRFLKLRNISEIRKIGDELSLACGITREVIQGQDCRCCGSEERRP